MTTAYSSEQQRTALTVEAALFGVLFLVALGLRLWGLGALPLNDVEAREALIVLRGSHAGTLAPASPAYFSLTALSFFLFGASDATARLIPALLGAGLTLVPALVRDLLGRGRALVIGSLLALSPALLVASRSGDSAIIGLFGLTLGLAAVWRWARSGGAGWLLVSGAALGLGVASGGNTVLGVLALALTVGLVGWLYPEAIAAAREALGRLWVERLVFGSALVGSALLLATAGLLYVGNTGALVQSWVAWLAAFRPAVGGWPAWLPPLFLVVYEPLLLVFGIVGAVRAFRSGNVLGMALAWFAGITFVLLVAYDGREPLYLVWLAVPLAALAGSAVYEVVASLWPVEDWPLAVGQVAVSLALLVFAALNVATFSELARGGRDVALSRIEVLGRVFEIPSLAQLGVALLAVLLVLVITYLFALGWSERPALLGLAATGALVLLAMTVGAGLGLAHRRADSPAELWWAQPASSQVRLLQETLGNVSHLSVGHPHDIEVTVQGDPNGTLGWILRDFPDVTFVDQLGPEVTSPVVITPSGEQNPALGSSYVGQDFVLRSRWTPSLNVGGWVNWLAYRRAPNIQGDPVILWVRQDVQQLTSTGGQ